LLPLLAAAGGLEEYRRISSGLFGTLLPQTSVLYGAGTDALLHNLEILVKWSGQALVPALPAVLMLLWAAQRARRARRRGEYDDRPVAWGVQALLHAVPWLFLWIVPPVLFFLLFHITKAGYTFVFLPGLLVAAAVACAPGLAGVGGRRLVLTGAGAASGWQRTWVAALLTVLVGAGIFLWAPDRRADQPRALAFVLHEFHPESIREYERDLDATLELVRNRDAESTLLLTVELAGSGGAAAEGYLYPWHRHLQWYAPDYPLVMLAPDEGLSLELRGHRPMKTGGEEIVVPAGIRRVLWVLAELPGERLRLPPAEVLYRGAWMTVLEGPYRGEMTVGPFRLVQEAPEEVPQSSQEPVVGSSAGSSTEASPESVGGRK
jgi:hypothetical protein